jgi:two-component system sensor histidine kinase YesM
LIHLLKNSIRIGVIFISIREEIDQIRDYISLQLLRYSDSFRVEFDLDERVYEYKCIKFILQPLVENAIYHGIDITSRNGVITIRVKKKGPQIEYTIEDNGKGIDQNTLYEINRDRDIETKTDGIGLQNVRLRLKTYFGENASLHIESEPGKGTRVFYSIPAERYE